MRTLDVVVGGMYGSEAKGHTTLRVVQRRLAQHRWVTNTRVGGPNAGHCVYDSRGQRWALRQVPVGVALDLGPGRLLDLHIAAGSEIDPDVLKDEITSLQDHQLLGGASGKRLYISPEATLIDPEHKAAETTLVGRVGSTGKGIGAARAARLMRTARRLADDPELVNWLANRGVVVGDPEGLYRPTVIEGTQGYALGLRAGHYPQTTSSDCRAIDFLSMAGLAPWGFDQTTVWVVARVYPIRVAGNSGPMEHETSWKDLGLEPERTTVTHKIRRVGEPDWGLLARAVRANGPQRVVVAMSMLDQMFPGVEDRPWDPNDPAWEAAEEYIKGVEDLVGAPVALVCSGPTTSALRRAV